MTGKAAGAKGAKDDAGPAYVAASPTLSPLRFLTKGRPTNQNMLMFRTMNRRGSISGGQLD
jgi:hypothetical protein